MVRWSSLVCARGSHHARERASWRRGARGGVRSTASVSIRSPCGATMPLGCWRDTAANGRSNPAGAKLGPDPSTVRLPSHSVWYGDGPSHEPLGYPAPAGARHLAESADGWRHQVLPATPAPTAALARARHDAHACAHIGTVSGLRAQWSTTHQDPNRVVASASCHWDRHQCERNRLDTVLARCHLLGSVVRRECPASE